MIKVGINGFGRIGRLIMRASIGRDDVEIVGVNDPFLTPDYACYLYKYDTVHGKANSELKATADGGLKLNRKSVAFFMEKEPENINWKSVGADYVIDCTGKFTKSSDAIRHLKGGAKKVIISAPGKECPTFVCGVYQ